MLILLCCFTGCWVTSPVGFSEPVPEFFLTTSPQDGLALGLHFFSTPLFDVFLPALDSSPLKVHPFSEPPLPLLLQMPGIASLTDCLPQQVLHLVRTDSKYRVWMLF